VIWAVELIERMRRRRSRGEAMSYGLQVCLN
jgi:hypothetical protein